MINKFLKKKIFNNSETDQSASVPSEKSAEEKVPEEEEKKSVEKLPFTSPVFPLPTKDESNKNDHVIKMDPEAEKKYISK